MIEHPPRSADDEVATAVNRGITRLMSMQTGSGGLAFWPGGREPSLWGTAYGGLALALAQKQKFSVPDAEAKKVFSYLSGQLRGMANDATGYGLSAQCLAVYTLALSGKPEPAYHDLLFQKRAKLSAEDRALVALAVIVTLLVQAIPAGWLAARLGLLEDSPPLAEPAPDPAV